MNLTQPSAGQVLHSRWFAPNNYYRNTLGQPFHYKEGERMSLPLSRHTYDTMLGIDAAPLKVFEQDWLCTTWTTDRSSLSPSPGALPSAASMAPI